MVANIGMALFFKLNRTTPDEVSDTTMSPYYSIACNIKFSNFCTAFYIIIPTFADNYKKEVNFWCH